MARRAYTASDEGLERLRRFMGYDCCRFVAPKAAHSIEMPWSGRPIPDRSRRKPAERTEDDIRFDLAQQLGEMIRGFEAQVARDARVAPLEAEPVRLFSDA
jgi:hypothetical protein